MGNKDLCYAFIAESKGMPALFWALGDSVHIGHYVLLAAALAPPVSFDAQPGVQSVPVPQAPSLVRNEAVSLTDPTGCTTPRGRTVDVPQVGLSRPATNVVSGPLGSVREVAAQSSANRGNAHTRSDLKGEGKT